MALSSRGKKRRATRSRPAKCSLRLKPTRRRWNGNRPRTEPSPRFMSKRAERKAEPEKPTPKIEKAEEARVKASPVARRIAAELGIDLSSVNGTGPEGRVTETDVRAAAKSKPATPAAKVPAAVKAGESARI